MTANEAVGRLRSILVSDFHVPAERITEDAHLRTDCGLDSLALTDLAFLVQSDFDFKADPDDFRGVVTVGALAEFIAKHAA